MTRIVGGALSGRRLTVPPSGARPTTDRVREALFSTIEHRLGGLAGTAVLDLFAGSGALALEAVSRGADRATLVEKDRAAVRVLRANAEALRVTGQITVVHADAMRWTWQPGGRPFDLVLVDPPYAVPAGPIAAVLRELCRVGALAPHALVAVERQGRDAENPLPEEWGPPDRRRYGDTAVWYGHAQKGHGGSERTSAMVKACCPGSFDPVTNGHIDVFTRASALFDQVTVGVLINKRKASLFTVNERIEMLREVTQPYPNIVVDSFHGLLVDYCRDQGISVVVKGLRAVTDFDYELQMAQMNHRLSGVETLFLTTNPEYGYLSSSLVKEVATYGGDVAGLVPDKVLQRIRAKLEQR